MIKLILPLPVPANRYWRVYQNRILVSEDARNYKAEIGWICRANDVQPLQGNLVFTVHVYRKIKRGDLDGKIKVLLDALQGHCYANDDQIKELHAYLHDDKHNPRVEIEIEAVYPLVGKE